MEIVGARALLDEVLTSSRIVGPRDCRLHMVVTPPASALQDPSSKELILNTSACDYKGLISSVSVSGGF